MREKELRTDNDRSEPDGKTISRLQRKIDQRDLTIKHLHDRLSRLQSSKRNKSSQIARLNKEVEALREGGSQSLAESPNLFVRFQKTDSDTFIVHFKRDDEFPMYISAASGEINVKLTLEYTKDVWADYSSIGNLIGVEVLSFPGHSIEVPAHFRWNFGRDKMSP